MRKVFTILCAAALLCSCGAKKPNGGPTVFQGRFIGYNNEFVEFFLPTDDGDFQEIPIEVQPDGSFNQTIQFDKNLYDAPLFADKFMFRICVEQGKTYNAEFDITEDGVETNFRFIGEGAEENKFLSHYWGIDEYEHMGDATSFKDMQNLLKGLYAPLRQELEQIPNKPFVQYYEKELDEKEKDYSYYYPFYAVMNNGSHKEDADFAAFLSKDKRKDSEFLSFMDNLCTNVAYMMSGIDVTEALKAAASCTAKPALKEEVLTKMITAMVSSGNISGLEEGCQYYFDNVDNEEYLDQVEELCGNALLLGPGSDAPDIEFEDINGKVFHLSDFVGKPLYVDLWASWCGPCCEEIPYLASFVESLGKDPEIVCISVSIDDEKSDWTGKLEEVGSTWPQYLATASGQDSIAGKYFISAIPRFLLIDANGKIASVNAPRPSESNLLESLKSML